MIDYLEDLLEEEAAVELTGRPLVPVGRRKVPLWEEDEEPLRKGQSLTGEDAPGEKVPQEGGGGIGPGRPSWGEEGSAPWSGAVRLLDRLSRAGRAAGAIRQQGQPLTVTLPGEPPRAEGLDLNAIDRAVQRDARRYDGGFFLY